jgi:hypothetical protein
MSGCRLLSPVRIEAASFIPDLSTAGDNPKGMAFPLCNQVLVKAKASYSSHLIKF